MIYYQRVSFPCRLPKYVGVFVGPLLLLEHRSLFFNFRKVRSIIWSLLSNCGPSLRLQAKYDQRIFAMSVCASTLLYIGWNDSHDGRVDLITVGSAFGPYGTKLKLQQMIVGRPPGLTCFFLSWEAHVVLTDQFFIGHRIQRNASLSVTAVGGSRGIIKLSVERDEVLLILITVLANSSRKNEC